MLRCLLISVEEGIKVIPLDLDCTFIAVFLDADFAPRFDSYLQLGFLITVNDKAANANIIHYKGMNSKRVRRSVFVSELFTLVLGFNMTRTIRLALSAILNRVTFLDVCTDSRSLYDCLTRINETTE